MNTRRSVRIANCSGYKNDPAWQMLRQIQLGDVDFVTGDYLAEMNLAEDAEAYRDGQHDGWEETAWLGLEMSLAELERRGTKVVINGGCLNPAGLAAKVTARVQELKLKLKVAYVAGDDLLEELGPAVASLGQNLPAHLDSANNDVKMTKETLRYKDIPSVPLVSANAYLGARAIVAGLRAGADIIICGRVSDASPVIGAAWYWHDWTDTDYDSLAGALVAGHLIECSAYVTGGNFSGFTEHDLENFYEPGFPIAEIGAKGDCVITKHSGTGGFINVDTVRCQLLYELQGNVYLHSDVKAYLDDVIIQSVGQDRVHVYGIKGRPPPPTTKAAIFYRGGYQSQLVLNASGYGTDQKWKLFEIQVRRGLKRAGLEDSFAILDFQIVGIPETNPRSQLRSTTYCRLFAEALTPEPLLGLLGTIKDIALQHFSGFHSSLDMRTALPKPFLAYYPGLYLQNDLKESVVLLESALKSVDTNGIENGINGHLSPPKQNVIAAGHPPVYEDLEPRKNYDTANPLNLTSCGQTRQLRLGDIVLARSGDKGSNLNCGLFVKDQRLWDWFRTFLSRAKMIELIGEDWQNEYHIERVEFTNIHAVHFVVYGILGRGVSGSSRLDCLGKGFADYIRDKYVEVPINILD